MQCIKVNSTYSYGKMDTSLVGVPKLISISGDKVLIKGGHHLPYIEKKYKFLGYNCCPSSHMEKSWLHNPSRNIGILLWL